MRVEPPRVHDRDLVWVETPFGEPAPRIVVAAARAGALGILDLGHAVTRARDALDLVVRRTVAPFAVRVDRGSPLRQSDLPDAVHTVVLADAALVPLWRAEGSMGEPPRPRRIVVEVRSVDEARLALRAGADGLVAKGAESGGRVGTTGAFVLGQQVRALTNLPLWVQGGIGRHTAAGPIVDGATGVVLDAQTALLRESTLPRPVRAAIAAMDGSETRVVAGHRIYNRPDLWVAQLDGRATEADLVGRLGAQSLTDQALPAGQDAALASAFAARYGTVGAMVTALRREIVEHVEVAQKANALAPGTGMAESLGTRYPVVQGPMTRVSDRAAFAEAVAENGACPFLALALLPGETEVRPLLEETAARLGDRPWGVGVLGFVPKALRDEQLAVIRDVRPPQALIAGGRPAQAVALEEVGIRTFLHVPAPGLLERFLRDGARRFVFEGFECGGHVGPRSSFALWEAQIEVLLEWGEGGGKLDEVDVLFAGGIHDAASAAMVAAVAGRLSQAGARVGVLMGTAYLFTDEAVASGAIGDEFQAQALACQQTALLESGPGHATRCAETPFVDTFNQTRQRLVDEGADPQAQWAELESLNLGRLRVASKGFKRDGDEIVDVDRGEQRTEGMFMIGDVATLRRERTTLTALHESVTTGATAHLAALSDRLDEITHGAAAHRRPEPAPVDVAIVGMACVMPGAPDVDRFWRNIVEGVNSITEVPADRWDVDTYFDPDWTHQNAPTRTGSASRWGGFLPDIGFDALAYGIPPASLAAIEPTQLLSLKVAADALTDAGYGDRPFDRGRTSVIFGAEGGTDQSAALGFRALFPSYVGELPPELDGWLPRVTEDSFPGLLTNVISGRVANRLDLGGRNITVDAACASSLAALDVACSELAAGGSDVVLCGGADLHNGIQDYLLFTSVHALSANGQCRPFDAAADGIALGEGVACVVLKRLEDAERDGDRVYAVVRAVAASSDGRSLGLTAPRQEGQERAVRRAYAQARVDARDVGLVEAHGTGTVVGDRTELSTLTEVFSQAGMTPGSCVVGSVKSNVGHTKCAAGLAGLIKAAKAVYHGVRPPTLHVERPNQAWDAHTSPFVFLDEARPWPETRRVAGVSAFGFGGTNFHVVLESHADDEMPDVAVDAWPAELLVFRGADEAAVDKDLAGLAVRLAEPVPAGSTVLLRDVAAAVTTAGRGPLRLAIVADDLDDLRTKVDHARAGRPAPGVYRPGPELGVDGAAPEVAFLFPGQGSQRPGMAGDLFVHFAETRPLLRLGARWAADMLPPQAFDDDGRDAQRRAVTDTRVAQPALGLADLAAAKVLARFGVRPGLVAGHSYGELVALCLAGVFDEPTLLELSDARAQAIVDAVPDDDPGGMVAVSAPRARIDEVLDGVDLVVANDNHPEQLVVAGSTPAVEEALIRFKDAGITARRLPVACAFHSPLVAAAAETLAARLEQADITEPTLPVFSNLTADAYPADARKLRDLLAGQLANGVRFTEEVRAMYDAGARVFVEVGPGRTLTGCVERILGDQPHLAVACDRPGDHGVRALLHALGLLAVAGIPVDLAALFEGRDVDATRWSTPAPAPRWTVNGHLVRTADGEVVAGGLRPATSLSRPHGDAAAVGRARGVGGPGPSGSFPSPETSGVLPVPTLPAATVPAVGGVGSTGSAPADQVLVEYFRAAQQIIGAGHDLLLNYLGYTPTRPAAASAVPLPLGVRLERTLGPEGPSIGMPVEAARVAPASAPPAAQPPPTGGPAMASSGGAALGTPDELLGQLTAIVSLRTGYPEDMLGPDLDVEADLSIDSIKRLEILAALADDIGLGDDGSLDAMEDLVEQLAARKTLGGIVDFLFEHADRLGAAPGAESAPAGGPSMAPASTAPVGLGTREELLAQLTAIVSLRTGYPEDMLGQDLDVEADLSIDSIKRLEILAALADDIGLGDDGSLDAMEDLVEQLASRKTLGGIVDFLFEHADRLGATADSDVAAPGPVGSEPGGTSAEAEAEAPTEADGIIPPLANRFVVTLADEALRTDVAPAPVRRVRVTGGNHLTPALVAELSGRGVEVDSAAMAGAEVANSGLVVVTDILDAALGSTNGQRARVDIPELYARIRPVLLDTGCDLVVVSPLGGGLGIDPPSPIEDAVLPVGAGVRGLVKTAALEFPDRQVRLVDVDPDEAVEVLARQVADELAQPAPPVEVGWRAGRRRVARISLQPDTAADGHREVGLALSPDSTVLLTGGARGITARVAVALAQQYRCRIDLLGRSALPSADDDPALAPAQDRLALRAALVAAGWREPRAIESECDRVLAAREVAATLAALEAAGSPVTYHRVDVRDAGTLTKVVETIYQRDGRLDGVVHGAGMLDDHRIVDKTAADFERVFATKVDGARTLVQALRRAVDAGLARPAFLAFFGSTAGVCGNRGQADYAAANDALDAMAASHRDLAHRVVALDWGPWSSEVGMVSDALAGVFQAAGMGLIQPDDGVGVMLDEIARTAAANGQAESHRARPHQVTVARCAPALMAAAFGQDPDDSDAVPGPTAHSDPGAGDVPG